MKQTLLLQNDQIFSVSFDNTFILYFCFFNKNLIKTFKYVIDKFIFVFYFLKLEINFQKIKETKHFIFKIFLNKN